MRTKAYDKIHVKTFLWMVPVLAVILMGCAGQSEIQGHIASEGKIKRLSPGVSREFVELTLGSPTTVTQFNGTTAYYMSQQLSEHAFFAPSVSRREILAINYNDANELATYEIYTLEDGNDIESVLRKTPTIGKGAGLIDQIMRSRARANSR